MHWGVIHVGYRDRAKLLRNLKVNGGPRQVVIRHGEEIGG